MNLYEAKNANNEERNEEREEVEQRNVETWEETLEIEEAVKTQIKGLKNKKRPVEDEARKNGNKKKKTIIRNIQKNMERNRNP